ncbi:hypothetical protein BCR36DRAFT_444512 [Piromyces finnis]|uniref:Uncharacterized protein n=1 Tax=Piromyces finnis TaxID=1754191 RepID=A0A1Y1VC70_9FUNG|nr:hypothetical protein BCR36DRAFT_444512 [Piromyces finnis]|eukprot:ORX52564.1 hypothetical protein BCR36DRAFT_444512 [Piromyces finnis]
MKFKFIKFYNKRFFKKSNKIHASNTNVPCHDQEENYNDAQQKTEIVQVLVDKDFDDKIKYLQTELNYSKEDIKKLSQLQDQLMMNINSAKFSAINKHINRLKIDISSRLRDIGTQLLILSNETKNKTKDKRNNIRISLERKLANDLKHLLKSYNYLKMEHQKKIYKLFKYQYMLSKKRIDLNLLFSF